MGLIKRGSKFKLTRKRLSKYKTLGVEYPLKKEGRLAQKRLQFDNEVLKKKKRRVHLDNESFFSNAPKKSQTEKESKYSSAEEDKEIAYLERKLGLVGPQREKNYKMLMKEWKEADGLEEDLLDFTDFLTHLGGKESHSINNKCFDAEALRCEESSPVSDSPTCIAQFIKKGSFDSENLNTKACTFLTKNVSNSTTHQKKKNSKNTPPQLGEPSTLNFQQWTGSGDDSFEASSDESTTVAANHLSTPSPKSSIHNPMHSSSYSPSLSDASRVDSQHIKKIQKALPRSSNDLVDTRQDNAVKENSDELSDSQDTTSDDPSETTDTFHGLRDRETSVNSTTEHDWVPDFFGDQRVNHKYIIPVKRKAPNYATDVDQTCSTHELPKDIQRKITGLVNRIVEGNLALMIDKIIDEIFVASASNGIHPKKFLDRRLNKVSSLFAKTVASTALENPFSMPSLVGSQVALIVCLTIRIGYQVGQQFIYFLIKWIEKHWNCYMEHERNKAEWTETTTSPHPQDVHDEVVRTKPLGEGEENSLLRLKSCLRLAVVAYSALYDFGLMNSDGISSLVDRFTHGMEEKKGTRHLNETRLELVLISLRYIGIKLRACSLPEFNQIIQQCRFSDPISQHPFPATSKRMMYFLQELEAMRRNKFNTSLSGRFEHLRTWIKTFLELIYPKQSQRFLEQYKFSISNWNQIVLGHVLPSCLASETQTPQLFLQQKASTTDQKTQALLVQAKKLRLHTDVQKNSFIAFAGAVNVHDAVQRLVAVAHKPSEIPNAVATLMHAALHETSSNAFYPQVLPSSIGKQYKRAVKQCIVDSLARVPDFCIRKIIILAYIVARLIMSSLSNLDLNILRFCRLQRSEEDKQRKRSEIFVSQVCKELCDDQEIFSMESSPTELVPFQLLISPLAKYPDLAYLFVLTAKKILQQKEPSAPTVKRANLVVDCLAELQG